MKPISVCLSPILYPLYCQDDSVVVVVDVFRATTSICTAFANGAKTVKTVADLQEAMDYKQKGYLVAAERNTRKCDFADFGNSPFEFKPELVVGKQLIFTTTNGTKAINTASDADEIVLGAYSNISALTNFCVSKNKPVTILCSGWNDRFCIEDTLFAGALTERLLESKLFTVESDATKAAWDLHNIAKKDFWQYVCQSEHYKRLKRNNLEDAIKYCLTNDTVKIVPQYQKIDKLFLC